MKHSHIFKYWTMCKLLYMQLLDFSQSCNIFWLPRLHFLLFLQISNGEHQQGPGGRKKSDFGEYLSTYTFVNSPFIKLSSNDPTGAGYGRPAGT